VSNIRFRVAVQPGEGVVGRFGAAVVVAEAGDFTTQLLDELDAAGGELSDALVWRLASQLTAVGQGAPSFGLLFATGDGYRVLLHGRVRALVDGEARLSGGQALTWVDALVDGPFANVALTLVEAGDVMPDARSDLRLGTMSGQGVVLTPVGGPVAQPVPVEPVAVEPVAAEPVPVPEEIVTAELAAADLEPEPEPEPEPEAEPEPQPEPEPPATATVSAPVVAEEQPAPTGQLPTQAPGFATVHSTRETVAVREVVSALMSDDGVRTPLDRPYVFGREPQQDPAVAEGHASPIRLPDPEQLISRVQAYLYVDGDKVTIQDAHSANGTFVAAPGAAEWQRIGEEPVALPVGWSIRMGRRIFTHYGIGG
jgi:hypothetical protein